MDESLADQTAKIEVAQTLARPASPKRNRGSLPAHLPRVEIVVYVADKTCPCCGAPLHTIAEDCAEMLDHLPAQFRVQVIRCPHYGCRVCEQAVVHAPAPDRPIDGGMATEALLAHVLVSKLPADADLCPSGRDFKPIHIIQLGRPSLLVAGTLHALILNLA